MMKNKIKYWMSSIGVLGVLFGRILNRVLEKYYGDNASNVVVAVAVAFWFCLVLLFIAMKQYITAIMLFIMIIPLIVSGIGLYLNNMDLVGLGILLIFIILPILIKVIPKMKRDK